MNEQIQKLVENIRQLEDELRTLLYEQQTSFSYKVAGKRVEFEESIRRAHKKLKTGWLYWFFTINPKHLLSAPFVYGLAVPLIIFDIGLSVYQSVCFRLYGIARVKRADHMVFDHRYLAYLNIFEKVNCLYCSYASGLLSYGREIASRTEQYWCPIKHAHKILDVHGRYVDFLDYGDAENYQLKMIDARRAIQEEK